MGTFFQILLENIPLILCMVLGVVLLVLEVFVPGFGLPGLSGLTLIIIGVGMVWASFGPTAGLAAALFSGILSAVSITASLKSAASGKLSRSPLFLKESSVSGEPEHRPMPDGGTILKGKEGVTLTVLNPVGFAMIGGERMDVITEGSYLEKGTPIVVTAAEGKRIIVRKKDVE